MPSRRGRFSIGSGPSRNSTAFEAFEDDVDTQALLKATPPRSSSSILGRRRSSLRKPKDESRDITRRNTRSMSPSPGHLQSATGSSRETRSPSASSINDRASSASSILMSAVRLRRQNAPSQGRKDHQKTLPSNDLQPPASVECFDDEISIAASMLNASSIINALPQVGHDSYVSAQGGQHQGKPWPSSRSSLAGATSLHRGHSSAWPQAKGFEDDGTVSTVDVTVSTADFTLSQSKSIESKDCNIIQVGSAESVNTDASDGSRRSELERLKKLRHFGSALAGNQTTEGKTPNTLRGRRRDSRSSSVVSSQSNIGGRKGYEPPRAGNRVDHSPNALSHEAPKSANKSALAISAHATRRSRSLTKAARAASSSPHRAKTEHVKALDSHLPSPQPARGSTEQPAARDRKSPLLRRSLDNRRARKHHRELSPGMSSTRGGISDHFSGPRANEIKNKFASLSIVEVYQAIIPVQSAIRSFLAKAEAKRRKLSIITIQSAARRWLCERLYRSTRIIAIGCQSVFRGIWVRYERDFHDYCALRIQAAARGYLSFMKYMDSLSYVLVIQSAWRMHRHRKRYVSYAKSTAAATLIQTSFRRFIASNDFKWFVSDLIICQSTVRRFLAAVQVDKLRATRVRRECAAAILIQANYRRFAAVNTFSWTVSDVIVIQSEVRRRQASHRVNSLRRIRDTNAASTRIQAIWRGYIASEVFICTLSDIICSQSAVRRWLARRRCGELRQSRNGAATLIQTSWRRHTASMALKIEIADIICVQSVCRQWVATKKLKAKQQDIIAMQQDAASVKIQSVYRAFVGRLNYYVSISCAISIQSAARRMIAMSRLAEERAAVKIQKTYRGFIVHENFVMDLANIICCQATVRRLRAIREVARRTDDRKDQLRRIKEAAATKIQACFRGHLAFSDFVLKLMSIITIQSFYRQRVAMETRNYLEHRFASAVKIQAIARGYIASVIAEENRFSQALEIALTSSQVQSSSSCSIVSREQPVSNAQSDIIATITLQAWWRMMLVSIRLAEDNAATVIQTCFRRYVGAMDYAIVQGSMIEIQAIVRGHIARRRAARLKHQRIYREKYANSLVRNSAATAIQTCFRGYRDFVQYVITMYYVTKLQACGRGFVVRNRRKKAALVIERFFISVLKEIEQEVRRIERKKRRSRRRGGASTMSHCKSIASRSRPASVSRSNSASRGKSTPRSAQGRNSMTPPMALHPRQRCPSIIAPMSGTPPRPRMTGYEYPRQTPPTHARNYTQPRLSPPRLHQTTSLNNGPTSNGSDFSHFQPEHHSRPEYCPPPNSQGFHVDSSYSQFGGASGYRSQMHGHMHSAYSPQYGHGERTYDHRNHPGVLQCDSLYEENMQMDTNSYQQGGYTSEPMPHHARQSNCFSQDYYRPHYGPSPSHQTHQPSISRSPTPTSYSNYQQGPHQRHYQAYGY